MQIRQPLTDHERRQILSQTGHAGGLIGIIAVAVAIVAGIGAVVGTAHVDWGLLGIITAIVAGSAVVLWTVITMTERGLKREVDAGEKVVVDGRVIRLSIQESNGVNFYCLRFQASQTGGAPLNVTVPQHVYRQLHENEPIQLTHLPISNLILAVNTKGFRWRIGDSATLPLS
jgi:hypothetical protein